jgi:AraC family transcriptional regulator
MAIREYAPIFRSAGELPDGVATWLANRLYAEYKVQDDVALLGMEELVLEILAELCRRRAPTSEPRPPGWLLRARDLLHARFAESLSLDEIGAEVGIHPVHFARVFRQQFKCTPGEYVRKLRLDAACRLLAFSDRPLIEIALSAGFADQSHFTRTLKRLLQMTPRQFRSSFRAR